LDKKRFRLTWVETLRSLIDIARTRSLLLLLLAFWVLSSSACGSALERSTPADASSLTGASSQYGEWAMEGYSPQRDRATVDDVQPPLKLQRKLSIAGETQQASPVGVAHGLLFVEGQRKLHAIALDSGTEQWYFDLPGSFLSPAISGDRVFVRAESGKTGYVLALAVESGAKLWQFKFPRVGSSYDNFGGHVTSPVVVDGVVLVGASRSLYALDASTGERKWVFGLKGPIASSATVADDTVYFADFTRLYAVDLATGEERWSYEHGTVTLFFAPVIAGDMVLITSYDTAYALDRRTGAVLWTQTIQDENIVPCAAAGEYVYVKSVNRLIALDRTTGAIAWSYEQGDFVSLPAVAGQQIYVVTRAGGTGHLRALRASDGQEIWRSEQIPLANAAPVVAGGSVYVRTVDGSVLVYAS